MTAAAAETDAKGDFVRYHRLRWFMAHAPVVQGQARLDDLLG